MRVVYIDIDTLRADHLGCYGYHRNTSPNIDKIAEQGIRFENCFNSDSPCLPSRAGMWMGRHGIHTGVVNHGGTDADPMREGADRDFTNAPRLNHWPMVMARNGIHTVSVSPFAERHSAWWFCAGFKEMYNTGKRGQERADEVVPTALEWLDRHGADDNWFLHVNTWDPHAHYRTPVDYGNPFEGDPPPDWITDETIAGHRQGYGPNSACEVANYQGLEDLDPEKFPRLPRQMKTTEDFRKWIDGYDTGIHYADMHAGQLFDKLEALGVLEDTAILISSDHGENQGELNIYGDHQTADTITSRVPCILKWPGLKPGVRDGFHYQSDVAATMLELWGMDVPAAWDGRSIAAPLTDGVESGRPFLVCGQNCWSSQRMVRFENYALIRTYHTGLKQFPGLMLFDVDADPHLQHNLADERPDIVEAGLARLERWHTEMMHTSDYNIDPMWNVIREGGPLHTRGRLESYCRRLRETGRAHHADFLEKQGGLPIDMPF
jgi:arylsulfatase A-like enzyme